MLREDSTFFSAPSSWSLEAAAVVRWPSSGPTTSTSSSITSGNASTGSRNASACEAGGAAGALPIKSESVCRAFVTFGYCKLGDRCELMHLERSSSAWESLACAGQSCSPDAHHGKHIPCVSDVSSSALSSSSVSGAEVRSETSIQAFCLQGLPLPTFSDRLPDFEEFFYEVTACGDRDSGVASSQQAEATPAEQPAKKQGGKTKARQRREQRTVLNSWNNMRNFNNERAMEVVTCTACRLELLAPLQQMVPAAHHRKCPPDVPPAPCPTQRYMPKYVKQKGGAQSTNSHDEDEPTKKESTKLPLGSASSCA